MIHSTIHSQHVRFQASESYLPAFKSSVPGQGPHSQEQEVLYLTQRLQTAQVDTQRHQKELTESHRDCALSQRAHNSSLRPSNTTETITTHKDKDPPIRPKSSRHKQMRAAQILHILDTDSQTTGTLTNLIQKPLKRKTEV